MRQRAPGVGAHVRLGQWGRALGSRGSRAGGGRRGRDVVRPRARLLRLCQPWRRGLGRGPVRASGPAGGGTAVGRSGLRAAAEGSRSGRHR